MIETNKYLTGKILNHSCYCLIYSTFIVPSLKLSSSVFLLFMYYSNTKILPKKMYMYVMSRKHVKQIDKVFWRYRRKVTCVCVCIFCCNKCLLFFFNIIYFIILPFPSKVGTPSEHK